MGNNLMPKIYRALWLLFIVFIIFTAITITFGIAIVAAVVAGIYVIYRRFVGKKKTQSFKEWPKGYTTAEIIDITSEKVYKNERDHHQNK